MSPFVPYILVTFGLNLPPFVLGVMAVNQLGGGCPGEARWMLVSGLFALAHIMGCVYIVQRIRQDRLEHEQQQHVGETPNTAANQQGPAHMEAGTFYEKMLAPEGDAPGNSWGRVKHVLCYDVGVAIYIILTIVWIFWQAAGLSEYFGRDSEACPELGNSMLTSLFCGWFYISLVGFAFLCSMCCMLRL
jgi:hypothetical protein